MKFSLIKNMVGALAPTLGSALGGPLGGQAASVIAGVLGCKSDPKSINQAIQAATPEQMLELKKAEQNFELQMKELEVDVFKLEVADKQDARGAFSKDWTARIIGIAVVGGFMGYIFLVTLQPPEQNSEALINLVLGYLGGLASAIISFYFGASNTPDKKMTNRKTAHDVSADLRAHEAKCEERWKTIFSETADIKKEMNDLNSTLRMATFGGFGFMATLLIAFLTGVVTI
jgi:hypothetical protein